MKLAARMDWIGTESAFEISARARALEADGHSIVHLQLGEPDFDTPEHVREAAKRALDEGQTHYAPYAGIPAPVQDLRDDGLAPGLRRRAAESRRCLRKAHHQYDLVRAGLRPVRAVAAIRGPQDDVDRMVAEFSDRRTLVVDGLNDIPGIACVAPMGAFYAFPNVAGTGLSGQRLADRLLRDVGVCVVPGSAFGETAGDYIRISYAASRAVLADGLARIRASVLGATHG